MFAIDLTPIPQLWTSFMDSSLAYDTLGLLIKDVRSQGESLFDVDIFRTQKWALQMRTFEFFVAKI